MATRRLFLWERWICQVVTMQSVQPWRKAGGDRKVTTRGVKEITQEMRGTEVDTTMVAEMTKEDEGTMITEEIMAVEMIGTTKEKEMLVAAGDTLMTGVGQGTRVAHEKIIMTQGRESIVVSAVEAVIAVTTLTTQGVKSKSLWKKSFDANETKLLPRAKRMPPGQLRSKIHWGALGCRVGIWLRVPIGCHVRMRASQREHEKMQKTASLLQHQLHRRPQQNWQPSERRSAS
mmetsp:Transcript_16859/g.30629  ORF Transcript_16859/g.30629 Transcript_16859/m.30629 type:complete len:232 (+) Transcript_16859:229-924(+)